MDEGGTGGAGGRGTFGGRVRWGRQVGTVPEGAGGQVVQGTHRPGMLLQKHWMSAKVR